MTVPVVIFPNPLRMMLDLLRAHPQLPESLAGKVCVRLPDVFPSGTPYLQVSLVHGGARPVPLRLATAAMTLNIYHEDLFTTSDLAATVTAIALALEQQSTQEGGFTRITLSGDPFPLQDPDTSLERYVIPLSVTYRPI